MSNSPSTSSAVSPLPNLFPGRVVVVVVVVGEVSSSGMSSQHVGKKI